MASDQTGGERSSKDLAGVTIEFTAYGRLLVKLEDKIDEEGTYSVKDQKITATRTTSEEKATPNVLLIQSFTKTTLVVHDEKERKGIELIRN